MKRIEKIEVKKSSGVYFYTGEVINIDADNVMIKTVRGETLIFRKEQIEGRMVIESQDEKQDDKAAQDDKP